MHLYNDRSDLGRVFAALNSIHQVPMNRRSVAAPDVPGYRLLFLFVADDRDLLLEPTADPAAQKRYRDFYATTRLRHLATRRAGSRHHDLYCGLKLVMEKLSGDGCPELALPALGSFLFSPRALPNLNACEISNLHFLKAIRSLAVTQTGQSRRVVDYKNLGAEELGSVYESLLELHPNLNAEAAHEPK